MSVDFGTADALQTPLRRMHEAMVTELRKTFGDRAVKPHAIEVDPETIRQHSSGPLALWAVIAAAEGTASSDNSQLRMDVRWAIFIVAQSWRSAGQSSPTARANHDPTYVAEAAANWVVRQAYRTRWSIQSGITEVKATDLKIHNLGIGAKTTAKQALTEHLSLFCVWGCQELDMGFTIAAGNEQFPDLESIAATIEDQTNPDKPSIKYLESDFTFAALSESVRAWWHGFRARLRRRLFGPDGADIVAARINAFIQKELVANA